METKVIKIGERDFEIKPWTFFDQIKSFETENKNPVLNTLNACVVKPEMTEDLLKAMTAEEGNALMMAINKLNGWIKDDMGFPKQS